MQVGLPTKSFLIVESQKMLIITQLLKRKYMVTGFNRNNNHNHQEANANSEFTYIYRVTSYLCRTLPMNFEEIMLTFANELLSSVC